MSKKFKIGIGVVIGVIVLAVIFDSGDTPSVEDYEKEYATESGNGITYASGEDLKQMSKDNSNIGNKYSFKGTVSVIFNGSAVDKGLYEIKVGKVRTTVYMSSSDPALSQGDTVIVKDAQFDGVADNGNIAFINNGIEITD